MQQGLQGILGTLILFQMWISEISLSLPRIMLRKRMQSGQGKGLPTEDEWEKAARGGLAGKLYPWGDEPPDKKYANFLNRVPLSRTMSVGSYPQNGYGLYDMAGNVSEWVDAPENDEWEALTRGGNWRDDEYFLKNYVHLRSITTAHHQSIGFRCVKDVPE